MLEPLPDELAALDAQVAEEPDSEDRRHDLLLEFLRFPELHGDPRRIEHIRWYVEHHPRHPACRSPIVAVCRSLSEEGFAEIERTWERQLDASPDDPELVMGAARLVAASDRQRGCAMLRAHLSAHPDAANVWFDLGCIVGNRDERLEAFLQARALHFEHPNLLCWIAIQAAEAGNRSAALEVVEELLETNRELRAQFGDKLDWSEKGSAMVERVRAATADSDQAWALRHAIAAHAHAKHHAHTALGLVALLDGRIDDAAMHLTTSVDVGSDYRLSSYGPQLTLARGLCEQGRWSSVSGFLRRCEAFWDDERLPGWIEDAERHVIPAAWLSEGE